MMLHSFASSRFATAATMPMRSGQDSVSIRRRPSAPSLVVGDIEGTLSVRRREAEAPVIVEVETAICNGTEPATRPHQAAKGIQVQAVDDQFTRQVRAREVADDPF